MFDAKLHLQNYMCVFLLTPKQDGKTQLIFTPVVNQAPVQRVLNRQCTILCFITKLIILVNGRVF
jgi:hypothetical protein